MNHVIFTYYSNAVSHYIVENIKSLLDNSGPYTELIICSDQEIPTKINSRLSSLIKTTRLYPNKESRDLKKLVKGSFKINPFILTAVSYLKADRITIMDPNVFVISQFNNTKTHTFFKTDLGCISSSLFTIKQNTFLANDLVNFLKPVITSNKPSIDFSYVVANLSQLIDKRIDPLKIILEKPEKANQTEEDKAIAIDLSLNQKPAALKKALEYRNKEPLKPFNKTNKIKQTNKPVIFKHDPPAIRKITENPRDPNRVSILMTNYNCEDFIEKAVLSIINQTYSNWELLIVDDCSTDSSLSIIKKLAVEDARIKVFTNLTNAGTYWSKNSLLKYSTGSFITCLDSDDIDLPNKLEKQLAEFKADESIKCVRCMFDRKEAVGSNVSDRVSIGYASAMFKVEIFDTIGYYDTIKFGADSEFFERLIRVYGKSAIHFIPEILQTGPNRDSGLTTLFPLKNEARQKYVFSFKKWHKEADTLYLDFPLKTRPFTIPSIMEVPPLSSSNLVQIDPFDKTIDNLKTSQLNSKALMQINSFDKDQTTRSKSTNSIFDKLKKIFRNH